MHLLKPIELPDQGHDWYFGIPNPALWEAFKAARAGDAGALRALIERYPHIVLAQFWYVAPLHFAVREGHLDCVELLLDYGADLSLRTLYGEETYLRVATDRGHAPVIEYLTAKWHERLASSGATEPVHTACIENDQIKLQELLDVDPKLVDRGDGVGRTPLHLAVQYGHNELVALLLRVGANVDAIGFGGDARIGSYGFRPIANALWANAYWKQVNNYELAHTLLAAGADYTITVAAALGDSAQVEALLSRDAKLANEVEPGGKRPLSAAAERNHIDIVKTLLDAGAQPNEPEGPQCPRGYALWAASRFGFVEIAELLLEAGADPNAQVESSGNPTESAANAEMRQLCYSYGGRVRMSQLFFEGNTDAIAALLSHAPERFTPLVATVAFPHCVSSNHPHLIRLLLRHGVRVPPQLTGCQTYLWHELDLTKLLLDHDMDPNLPNWQSIRPLHLMARKNEIDAARLFLSYGADVDAVDEEYRTTPLGWAAMHGKVEFAKFLLEQQPRLRTELPDEVPSWSTPLAWAERRGHKAISELLQRD